MIKIRGLNSGYDQIVYDMNFTLKVLDKVIIMDEGMALGAYF